MEHITASSHDLACLIPGDTRTLLPGRASTLRRAKGPTLAQGNWVILFWGGRTTCLPLPPVKDLVVHLQMLPQYVEPNSV